MVKYEIMTKSELPHWYIIDLPDNVDPQEYLMGLTQEERAKLRDMDEEPYEERNETVLDVRNLTEEEE